MNTPVDPRRWQRMSWTAKQQHAARRRTELREAAVAHYARFGNGPSAYMFQDMPNAEDAPTNITNPALSSWELLAEEERAAKRVLALRIQYAPEASACTCSSCRRRAAWKASHAA